MLLPGMGESLPACDVVRGFISCPDGHYKRVLRDSCQRVECPVCFRDWARKAARRCSDLLRGVRSAYYHERRSEFGKVRSYRHIVFSPPQNLLTPDSSLDDAYRLFSRFFASYHPMHGGIVIYHPYRIRPDLQERLRSYILSRNSSDLSHLSTDEDVLYHDGGFWDLARADVLGLGSFDSYYYFSPHYHVLGFGFLPPSDVFHSDTGWVYVNLKDRAPNVREHPRTGVLVDEVENTVAYQLTHAGVERGPSGKFRDSYRRFGICSVSHIRLARTPTGSTVRRLVLESVLKCPVCGAPLTSHTDLATGESLLTEHDLYMLYNHGLLGVGMRKVYRLYELKVV